MITLILLILGTFGCITKAQDTSYGDDDEDKYDEEYYSDEYEEEEEITTTEKPQIVLDGWHIGMLTAGAALALMTLGAVIGAYVTLQSAWKNDWLYGCGPKHIEPC